MTHSAAASNKAKKTEKDVAAPLHRFSETLAGDVLRSVGECVFDWDVASDRLHWSSGAARLLCVKNKELIATDADYSKLLLGDTPANRRDRE